MDRLRAENESLSAEKRGLESQIRDFENRRNALAVENEWLRAENESLSAERKEHESSISDLETRLTQSDSKVQDLTRDKKELEMDCRDLEDTNRHLRREKESLAGIDVGGIVGSFVEFSTGVCNAVLDNDDIGKVRDIVGLRLDQLSNSVSSRGMALRAHRRGDVLTERDVVEAIEVPTCDRSRDWTVKSSNGFGFSFGNADVQDIAERVSVYVYNDEDPPVGDGTPDSNPTSEEAAPGCVEEPGSTEEASDGQETSGTAEGADSCSGNPEGESP